MRLRRPVLAALAVLWAAASVVSAQRAMPGAPPPGQPALEPLPILKDVRIDQKLDQTIPLDLTFTDEQGRDVTLGTYFGRRPVVLALAYYECPMLCTQVLNGVFSSMEPLRIDAGRDFDVVVVSIDPGETPAMARAKRAGYVKHYQRATAESGIHFLTGRQAAIDRLADAVGFRYVYDEAIDQYAHPATIMVLTPQGKVSKYLYGVAFAPMDFRLAVTSAGEGQIGSLVDQALLYCFHYDPSTGKYSLAILTFVRIGAVLTMAAIGAFLFVHLRRERRQRTAVVSTATGTR